MYNKYSRRRVFHLYLDSALSILQITKNCVHLSPCALLPILILTAARMVKVWGDSCVDKSSASMETWVWIRFFSGLWVHAPSLTCTILPTMHTLKHTTTTTSTPTPLHTHDNKYIKSNLFSFLYSLNSMNGHISKVIKIHSDIVLFYKQFAYKLCEVPLPQFRITCFWQC